MYTYFYQQFGPFDRHGQQLREDDDKTLTIATAAGTITTMKTETKDKTMDEFWKMMLSPPRSTATQRTTKTEDPTMDAFWEIIFPSTSP